MRRGLVILGGLLAAGLLIWQLGRGLRLPLFDFVEYWAAGRLLAEGRNPYDPEAIEQLERAVGTEETVLMWNPPWALPLVLPFGMLDARLAHLLWLLVQFAALAVS